MKKLITIALALMMLCSVLVLASCDSSSNDSTKNSQASTTPESTTESSTPDAASKPDEGSTPDVASEPDEDSTPEDSEPAESKPSLTNKEPKPNSSGQLVGDMDGDGDVDDFDLYVQEEGDHPDMDGDGIITKSDAIENLGLEHIYNTELEQRKKEFYK